MITIICLIASLIYNKISDIKAYSYFVDIKLIIKYTLIVDLLSILNIIFIKILF